MPAAERYAMNESLNVVLGDRRYRVERDWGELPDGIRPTAISTVAVDSQGRVYAYRRGSPPVVVFDAAGRFVAAWGQDRIVDAHGIFVTGDDRVFLVNRDAHEVIECTPDGAVVRAIGRRHEPRFGAPFNHPTDVAVAADGEFYVTDGYGNALVHRFDADGAHLQSCGEPGSGPGAFSVPHAVWIDKQDRVLVADRENNRIQAFDRNGAYLTEWGGFLHPMDLFVDDRGLIFVSDQTPSLCLLSPSGALLGRCKPMSNGAHGIWGNADGDLFLAEMDPSRLTKLSMIE